MRKMLILIFILPISVLFGQEMITDLMYQNGDNNSYPSDFIELNQKVIFTAISEGNGKELWISNGKKNEAFLLKDINPGSRNGIQGRLSESSVIINNTLYFIACDGNTEGEIWKTDGTIEGTVKVTDYLDTRIKRLTLINNQFYFLIKENETLQVWKSDGSSQGTKLVKDNISIWNSPTFEGKCNNTFIFTFQPYGTNDSRVWRSDGTAEGTYPITDEIDGNGAGPGGTSALTQYIEHNNELYFVSRYYLHKTDGTVENTKTITTMHYAATDLVDYADVIELNGKLYFSFFTINNNRLSIWETDGTSIGSKQIYSDYSYKYFMPSNLLGIENKLVFCGANDTGGTSLICLNVLDYSKQHIRELISTVEAPYIFWERYDLCILQKINDNQIFCATVSGRFNKKGWFSGLTEASTNPVEELNNVSNIFVWDESFLYANETAESGVELWKYDIPGEQFTQIENLNKSKFGIELFTRTISKLEDKIIFNAFNDTNGNELWSYNSETGLTLLKDIYPGDVSSHPNNFKTYNNELFFTANNGSNGYELWKTNGTTDGTAMVHDLTEGSSSIRPQFLRPFKNDLFFIFNKNNHNHLCKLNSTGYEAIKDLGENDYGYALSVVEMIAAKDYLFFVTEGHGHDLWVSDGTEAGTYKIKKFNNCNKLTDVDGKLFYTASETYLGEEELWLTDMANSTTQIVKDINLGDSSEPKDLTNYKGSLVFTAITPENGRELWLSDGTEPGTKLITDINPGSQSSINNAHFCELNNSLYFCANDGENGMELWTTNATAEGTSIVKDINTGENGSFPNQMLRINDLFYFQAFNDEFGSELWKSDGTEIGTVIAADIRPGRISSSPSHLISTKNDIFCIAGSSENGRQIWKIKYNLNSSINDLETTHISIYPNPCIDIINFNFYGKINNIRIYNSKGQLLQVSNKTHKNLDVSHLSSGLYILQFDIDGKTINKKIIKE